MVEGRSECETLLACATPGERRTLLAEFFEKHKDRLRLMVRLRLDRRLQVRVDPSDVLQEAFLEAMGRLDEYLRDRPMPLFLWIRRMTGQKLCDLHVRHLDAAKRSVRREVRLEEGHGPEATSETIAAHLEGDGSSPSEAAARAEVRRRLEEALERMQPMDREAIALRFLERLSSVEVAEVLGIEPAAARTRCFRALKRLRDILGPGFLGDEA